MSDFVNEFWNWYVILIVLISVIACGVFLWSQSIHHPGSKQTTDTTGHRWDETLEEYNNPLPRWWMWLFYGTVIFALIYVALYPALGRIPGIFGWTSVGEHTKEVAAVDAQVKPLFEKFQKMDLKAVAADKEAMEMAGRLFQTYCIQCHGVTGQGSRDKGFPNLTDKDWQWGGEPEQIVETISNGRMGVMAARPARRKWPTTCVHCRACRITAISRRRAKQSSRRSVLPATARTARACRLWERRT